MKDKFAGGFSTLTEEMTANRLPLEGHVLDWLTCSPLRNGPARFEIEQHKYLHWFDDLAMLYSFSFHQGQASYANCFIQSPASTKAEDIGQISYGKYVTDLCRSLFKRVASVFSVLELSSNTKVNTSKLSKRFVALTETPLPIEFDRKSLRTVNIL
jgi:carotenoid cleavage dioxygenase-like enzyme